MRESAVGIVRSNWRVLNKIGLSPHTCLVSVAAKTSGSDVARPVMHAREGKEEVCESVREKWRRASK